ncbi:cytochrome P450 [Streptomyces sp. NPDC090088]|uniref:cytochrome P450 n=1 Tax=Streptomyces sp. NPDC090088 TaxID=3365944 RepID=UPI0038302CA8
MSDTSTRPSTADEFYRNFDHYNVPIGPDGTPFDFLNSFRDAVAAEGRWVSWCESYGGYWLITGWEEARAVFRDPRTFENGEVPIVPPWVMPSGRPQMLTGYDGARHMKYRRLVHEAFSSSTVARMYDEFATDARHLISRFSSGERADLAADLATRFAHTVVARLTGLPLEEADKFGAWVHAITHSSALGEDNSADLEEMKARFDQLLVEHRQNPTANIMSELINSGAVDGEALTHDDLIDFFAVFILGSIENTSLLLADVGWLLAQRPELRRRLLDDPDLYDTFIDESLRFFSTASGAARTATVDTEIGGVKIKAGEKVFPYLPLIDRDPREFVDPDAFDPARTPNRAFALGFGPHRCLGANLIRVELAAVVKTLLEELPDFELDPAAPSVWTPSHVAGMISVPILLGGLP